MYKYYTSCKVCEKEVLQNNFNRHLATHYNPISKNCKTWYKPYFTKDGSYAECIYCKQGFKHETNGILSGLQYEEHLYKEHKIKR